MAHSFSSLKMLEQCPRQYKVVRIDKLYPYKETPETAFGNRVHDALDKNINAGHPLPADLANYQWVVDSLIPALLPWRMGEVEYSFKGDGGPAGHRDWANKYWSGKADVFAVDQPISKYWRNAVTGEQATGDEPRPTQAQIIDWKTGKSGYPDPEQLELMAMFAFWADPSLQVINGYLVFLQDAKVVRATFTKQQLPGLEVKWKAKAAAEEQRRVSDDWPAVKSHLCPWCPHTACENWTPPKPKRA
jgi:RecB family exonuclease